MREKSTGKPQSFLLQTRNFDNLLHKEKLGNESEKSESNTCKKGLRIDRGRKIDQKVHGVVFGIQ